MYVHYLYASVLRCLVRRKKLPHARVCGPLRMRRNHRGPSRIRRQRTAAFLLVRGRVAQRQIIWHLNQCTESSFIYSLISFVFILDLGSTVRHTQTHFLCLPGGAGIKPGFVCTENLQHCLRISLSVMSSVRKRPALLYSSTFRCQLYT